MALRTRYKNYRVLKLYHLEAQTSLNVGATNCDLFEERQGPLNEASLRQAHLAFVGTRGSGFLSCDVISARNLFHVVTQNVRGGGDIFFPAE